MRLTDTQNTLFSAFLLLIPPHVGCCLSSCLFAFLKSLEPKYKRVAMLYPNNVKFMSLNWEETRVFCKTVGVTALPYVKVRIIDPSID